MFKTKGDPKRINDYVSGSAIQEGDPVTQDNSGRVSTAAASQPLCGVAAHAVSAAGQSVSVFDHPDQEFTAHSDDSSIDAQTDLMLNYNIVASSATNTTLSNAKIDGNTGATNSDLPIKVLRVSKRIGNKLGANVEVECQINNHQLKGGTGTEGV